MPQLVFIHGPGAGACADAYYYQLKHFPGSVGVSGSRTRLARAQPPKNRACAFRSTRLKPLKDIFQHPASQLQ